MRAFTLGNCRSIGCGRSGFAVRSSASVLIGSSVLFRRRREGCLARAIWPNYRIPLVFLRTRSSCLTSKSGSLMPARCYLSSRATCLSKETVGVFRVLVQISGSLFQTSNLPSCALGFGISGLATCRSKSAPRLTSLLFAKKGSLWS